MTLTQNAPLLPENFNPAVETALFAANPEAHFWLGVVASERELAHPVERHAAGVLRANIYIDQWHFLPTEARQADGSESDADDERSTHYAALYKDPHKQVAHVGGNMRVIRKRHEQEPLPVERLFPEAFTESPAPVNAIEASRFIANHNDKLTQSAISLGLIRAVVLAAYEQGQQPIYAVVESKLERRFKQVGLPVTRIAEPKPLGEYNNTVNMALRFDPVEIVETTERDQEVAHMITAFFRTSRENGGVGLYDPLLMVPVGKKA